MIYIIFIILVIGTLAFIIFTYESRISNLKNDLIILTSNLNNLKSKMPKGNTSVHIDFKIPSHKLGLIKSGAMVYLSPDEQGIIEKTSIHMEVAILDECFFKNSTWFYVALPVNRSDNSRGWINKKFFTSFQ
ncbi:MAG: hypothetical protein ACRC28_01550 [Clostridium sp.]|uniref:hypothetical protein n=1 Tax=Clostridium sp. TaxID=1506 RepID=UPI003F361077